MLKLMKLEMKKFKIKGYIKGVLIANIIILGLISMMSYTTKNDKEIPFTDFSRAFSMVDTLVKATFIIFGAVILSKVIIDEYKNKTISVLFMYPINRKKLMVSKLLIVAIFTFLTIFLSDIFISSILCVLDSINSFIPEKLTGTILLKHFIGICLTSITSAGMSLIPLYFGMRKKSVPATIVSSILIVTIICSSFGNEDKTYSLSSIVAIPISLAIIGLAIAYFAIRNIEDVDAF